MSAVQRTLKIILKSMPHNGVTWLMKGGSTWALLCEQRLHFRCVSWLAKSSLCQQLFKSVQKSGQIS